MCGIAGILPLTDQPESGGVTRALDVMVRHLAHRGPDDQGVVTIRKDFGQLGFGHTRLAILDLSPSGHQPMFDSQNDNCITFNGEIYNFKELRQKESLASAEWKSQTDTETILKSYAHWGKDCVHHFRGMFAFAIWDAQTQELFLARDHLGIKPLFYYSDEKHFVFASEIRALLASGLVPRVLDPGGLWDYMAYQSVPAPSTLIKGVRALLPGSWLTVDLVGRTTEKTYWGILENASEEARDATETESRGRVRELLRESIGLNLVSDVPVAAFLSGGIDSSAVVALMKEAGQTAQTFSVVFTEKAYTEAQYAREVASQLHTDHTEILLTERNLLDQLLGALSAMDQPTGDGVNTYVVSRAVRAAGVKVSLSGLGGDELFGGYPSFARLKKLSKYLRVWGATPERLRAFAVDTAESMAGNSVTGSKAISLLRSDGTLASTYPVLRQVLSISQRRALLQEHWLRRVDGSHDPYTVLLRETFARNERSEAMSRISFAEARTYMHDVLLHDTDQMSMAHALEVRVPLLDSKLVEYVMGLPDAMKHSNGIPKRLLVESLGGLLPKQVVNRPKQGFTLPFDPWMRGALRPFCEARLSPERIGSRGIVKHPHVHKLWHDFLEGKTNVSWSRLWILVVLEEWLERNQIMCDA